MKSFAVYALALLLVTPVLARPNLVEPIYLRRRSNPLEITEESIEANSSSDQGSTEKQLSATEAATDSTGSDGSTSPGVSSSTSPSTSTHQPSYAFKRPELLKTKLGTSGFVVSTSTKVLTGGGASASHRSRPPTPPADGTAKANEQLVPLFDRFAGHAGVAEPMTDEEYQNELHRATERTTTPREGLSTWVLLSGSDSSEMKSESATSTTRKAVVTTTTMVPATITTPKTTPPAKRFQPTTRRPMPTTTGRPARTTTTSTVEEKKEKLPNKALPKQKIASTTLKPVIVKKVKKPVVVPMTTTTTTTTTTTPKPTTAAPVTTTEMVLTEQSVSTVANDLSVTEDASAESSTFLILEPKDALFDLPEDRSPAKTAPVAATGPKTSKKPTRKPNSKNPSQPGGKKKPATGSNKKTRKPEVKDVVANEKKPGGANKNKPVSTQIINYLSREVMPTVGVGLVGLVMAAGLASYFLGSPLGALRRSDDRKDDLYYSNYEEYAGPDGQNEEDVFGKLIAGMPDRSYYRNGGAVRRRTQVQPVRTGHQYYHVQPYSANKYPHITYRNRAYGGPGGPNPQEPMYTNVNQRQGPVQGQGQGQAQVQAKSQNEFYYNTPPTPYYPMRNGVSVEASTRASAPVYSTSAVPSTSTTNPPPEVTNAPEQSEPDHEMMPHPEAYSAEHSPEHHAHYVVGASYSDTMLDMINSGSVPEHGPRRKRRAISSGEEDGEFANEIDVDENRPKDVDERPFEEGTESANFAETTTIVPEETTTSASNAHQRYTWGDFIRNTVERKVAMGIHFLQHVTSDFQRYLSGMMAQHNHTTTSSDVRRV